MEGDWEGRGGENKGKRKGREGREEMEGRGGRGRDSNLRFPNQKSWIRLC